MIDRVIGIATLLIVASMLAVVVSKRANTAKVLEAGLSGFSKAIRASSAPVTGK